jgi:hypothetical protein
LSAGSFDGGDGNTKKSIAAITGRKMIAAKLQINHFNIRERAISHINFYKNQLMILLLLIDANV